MTALVASGEVIVWNTDVRNRPELEVDIQIVTSPADVPGEHYARSSPGLEVELLMVDSLEVPMRGDRLFTAVTTPGLLDVRVDARPDRRAARARARRALDVGVISRRAAAELPHRAATSQA